MDTNLKKPPDIQTGTGFIPTRWIVLSVSIVCLSLLGSAIFGFTTLLKMHSLYLSNRGNEILLSIESQARGAGRRNNPEFWKTLLEEKYETYADFVAYLALVDRDGRVLAAAGKPISGFDAEDGSRYGRIFNFEEMVGRARGPRGEEITLTAGWKIRIGLYTGDADFIRNQAWILLAVSGAAIAALIIVSMYFLRTLKSFLELKMRESSEAHLKSLGIMAASLAHEIRNPLGSMKGLTQLVQEGLPGDHWTQENLSTVVSEAERLERLVSDLLDFARPKEPQINLFNLKSLIGDVASMLENKFKATNILFRLELEDGPETVRSDAGGVRQVLLNVLMNALNATPEGGTVVLKTMKAEMNGVVAIQVDDTGPGLGGRNAADLFEPFVSTGTRGTGLGLTISR
ncbi:MAG: histidine kinase dimerization/phospho-acceptor domain-containing protein, partial [Acidobacteriota bacterium]